MEYCDSDPIKLLLHEPVFHNSGGRARCIHGIHCVFLKEVTVALSFPRVSPFSFLNIVKVDGDKAASVRSCMLVDKAKSKDLHCPMRPSLKKQLWNGKSGNFLNLPVLSTSLLHILTPSRMRTQSSVESVASWNLRPLWCFWSSLPGRSSCSQRGRCGRTCTCTQSQSIQVIKGRVLSCV